MTDLAISVFHYNSFPDMLASNRRTMKKKKKTVERCKLMLSAIFDDHTFFLISFIVLFNSNMFIKAL